MIGRKRISAVARSVTVAAGSELVSVLAVVVVIGWVLVGIPWGFHPQWHKWLHSSTSLVTLLMLFVIQHTTNRESRAALVKLDELLRIHDGARGDVMSVENADPKTQDAIEEEMEDHADNAPTSRHG